MLLSIEKEVEISRIEFGVSTEIFLDTLRAEQLKNWDVMSKQ